MISLRCRVREQPHRREDESRKKNPPTWEIPLEKQGNGLLADVAQRPTEDVWDVSARRFRSAGKVS